ncbi:RDD family protein [Streptomyces sp. ISL-100]|uniref:RDD family protein n=1 Tax=Streptomyces sp. ISL-100 TaxID=2819173 RepID=UPI001BE9BB2C|nr:RDD family protein [Streptomyces sp. ISL-100]MBT2399451.1 RDD family protein [Streptomyces sp. ISL-100]
MSYPGPQGPFAASQAPAGYPPPQQMAGAQYPPFPQPGSPYAPQHPPYAGWLRRAGAFLLDILINFGPMWLLMGIANAIGEGRSGDSGEIPAAILGWGGLIAMIATLVVQLMREGRTGQTVGKRALGIRAVRDRDGLMPGIGLALGRRLCQFLNYAVFGLGWWWAIWDTKSQTFADKITSVVVVRADAGPARQPAAPWQ